jgi:hypothetical protein
MIGSQTITVDTDGALGIFCAEVDMGVDPSFETDWAAAVERWLSFNPPRRGMLGLFASPILQRLTFTEIDYCVE